MTDKHWSEEFNDLANATMARILSLEKSLLEAEALRPDAMRYRFLRDGRPEAINIVDMVTKTHLTGDRLDCAVDAAMAYEL